ncbi:hypothetical protein HMPREF1051_0860 [Neisseria sicca VK64]|uniref:Uncharacterized protein n=1 Tax=Neisseria sicca VK64 TaxID=1095748 RepID=I2NVX9_NEISI|nr:hypothetical protein HMPREF1051_0860 [Neisseria sicca VK64]
MPRLAVLSVLSAASSPCPDLNLIHYNVCINPPAGKHRIFCYDFSILPQGRLKESAR